MLAYLLGLVVGFGSLAIYLSAFFFPEIHRKHDFIWSGVGLFYALVLWIFAPQITGGLLLGHIASVSLLVWFGWQTLFLRRQLIPEVQQTPLPSPELVKVSLQEQISKFSVKEKLGQLSGLISGVFSGAKAKVQQTVSKKPVATTEAVPPSALSDAAVTVTPANKTEGLSAATVSQSSLVEIIEVTPTPPPVIDGEEKQVIPPTEPPIEAETETVVEVTQTVVEVTQTEVFVSVETSIETASAPEIIAPNPATSELLPTDVGEDPAMPVEEVKPEGEKLPEQKPLDQPSGD